MLAMYARIDRVRAIRQLDALAVQAAPHMEPQAHSTFVEGLIDRVRGVVTGGRESVTWNGSVMRSARELKATALKMLGSRVAA
jgi:hypothetical protein